MQDTDKAADELKAQAQEQTLEQEQPAQEAATEEQQEPTVEELMAAMKAENEKLQDLYMRAMAEMENTRRRAEDSVEKAHKFAVEKFAKNLLPVMDSMEKAIEAGAGDDSPMMQGVQATYRQLLQALQSSGMEEINPVNEAFDPTRHQAITMVPAAEGQTSGHVAQVYQHGWILHGRVLRAAMVAVVQ